MVIFVPAKEEMQQRYLLSTILLAATYRRPTQWLHNIRVYVYIYIIIQTILVPATHRHIRSKQAQQENSRTSTTTKEIRYNDLQTVPLFKQTRRLEGLLWFMMGYVWDVYGICMGYHHESFLSHIPSTAQVGMHCVDKDGLHGTSVYACKER